MLNNEDIWKTQWDLIRGLAGKTPGAKRSILETLCRQYSGPVYDYMRRRVRDENEAEEVTAAFFASILQGRLFERADANVGRFRSYLLGALRRFVAKYYEKKRRAPVRFPSDGDGSDGLVDMDRFSSPEVAFHYRLVVDLLEKAIESCRRYYGLNSNPRKKKSWDIFEDRLLRPIFEGVPKMTLPELSAKYDIPVTSIPGILINVKRRLRRVLYATIGKGTSDAGKEMSELIEALG
jgi:RNA polymerase sigma-70 factor (ECF subfamily)